jgi:hypothetical protein
LFLVAVQTILATVACYGLWRLLRVLCGYGRVPGLIIGAGFVARAILSQILFWVSYLRLPFGRSLQLGPGFWFFGVDSEYYFHDAIDLVHHPWAAVTLSEVYPSRFFIQVFTLIVGLFGPVPSVGILLNCAAYTGICFFIVRLGLREGKIALPAVFALAAVSFSPAGVLWSMQPLKDTFFLFVTTLALAACFKWYELWTSERSGGRALALPLLATAAALVAAVWALSSMRWYFGLVLWLSCAMLFAGAVMASHRKTVAAFANIALFLVLPQIVLASASADIPGPIRAAIHWRTAPTTIIALPGRATAMIRHARDGFDHTPGATTIQAGSAIADPPPAPPAPSAPPVQATVKPQPEPAPRKVEVASMQAPPAAPIAKPPAPKALPHESAKKMGHVVIGDPAPVPVIGTLAPPVAVTETAPPLPAPATTESVAAATAVTPTAVVTTTEGVTPTADVTTAADVTTTAGVTTREVVTTTADATTTAGMTTTPLTTIAPEVKPAPIAAIVDAPAEKPKRTVKLIPVKMPVEGASKPAPIATPIATGIPAPIPASMSRQASTTTTSVPMPHPAPPAPSQAATRAEPSETAGPPIAVPKSTAERFITGFAATFLPRSVAQKAGLIRVGGGRGFWFFADLDTLVFDAVVLFVVFDCTRRLLRRRGRPTAMFLLVAAIFVMIALPVVYTVNNFGTLFRHRQMIYLTLSLLPLALAGREERPNDAAQA